MSASKAVKEGTGHLPSSSLPEVKRFVSYGQTYADEVECNMPDPMDALGEDGSGASATVYPAGHPKAGQPIPKPAAGMGSGPQKGQANRQARYGSKRMSQQAHSRAMAQPPRNTKQEN